MNKLEKLLGEKEHLENRLRVVNEEIENTPQVQPLSELGREAIEGFKKNQDRYANASRNRDNKKY